MLRYRPSTGLPQTSNRNATAAFDGIPKPTSVCFRDLAKNNNTVLFRTGGIDGAAVWAVGCLHHELHTIVQLCNTLETADYCFRENCPDPSRAVH